MTLLDKEVNKDFHTTVDLDLLNDFTIKRLTKKRMEKEKRHTILKVK